MNPSDEKVKLGAFELVRRLGQGGMGEVWLGRHQNQSTPVAIKLISPQHSTTPNYQHAFQLEVQAVARLNHPGICRVLDYGHTQDRLELEPKHIIPPQTPWLAMSLYDGGSLEERAGLILSWPQLKNCLLQLLDALAHAHARGTIHRDLKPGNVLLQREQSGLRYVLTDFGLAHPTTRVLSKRTQAFFAQAVGTPYYMPPEQIEGRWRDFGPWTDLYALGCMAYELAQGQPPFMGKNAIEVVKQHLYDKPAPLKPRFEVPEGFDRWLSMLIAKPTAARFERAADALWALLQIAPSRPYEHALTTLQEHTSEVLYDGDFEAGPATLKLHTQTMEVLISQDDPSRHVAPSFEHIEKTKAPLPERWQTPYLDDPPELLNVGLGLFSMREIPFVGRTQERDLMWETLRQVKEQSTPELIVVQGAAGTGKSRLVEWIAQRAEETGAATLFKLKYDQDRSMGTAISDSIAQHLRCQDLDYEQTLARINAMLEASPPPNSDARSRQMGAAALASLISPHPSALIEPADLSTTIPPHVTFSTQRERQLATMPLFGSMATQRTLIVWLDDLQWGLEDLDFIRSMLDHPRSINLPILIIATIRNEDPYVVNEIAPTLRALKDNPRAHSIELGPLSTQEHLEFLRRLLPLEPKLQEKLSRRTDGNPLFALQLVRDWVTQGTLIPGARGFTHYTDQQLTIPDSIYELWRSRIDALTRQGWPNASGALELGVAFGHAVIPTTPWHQLCQIAGYTPVEGLLDELSQQGLIHQQGAGWSLSHQMLRESLERQSRESGRWIKLHKSWANWMQNIPRPNSHLWLLDLGHHFLESERFDEARRALLKAATIGTELSDYVRALDALKRYEQCCDALKLGPNAPQRVSAWPRQAEALRFMGRLDEANELVNKTLEQTDDQLPTKPRADALRIMASAHMLGYDVALSQAYNRRAISIYEEIGDRRGLIDALHTQGWFALNTQQYEQAQEVFNRGAHMSMAEGSPRLQAWCQQGLTELALRSLSFERARQSALNCLALFERQGARAGVGMCLGNLAEIELFEGKASQAWEHATQGLEILEVIGSGMRIYCHVLLGLLDLMSGAPLLAIERMEPWLQLVSPHMHYNIHTMIHLILMASRLQLGQEPAAAAHLEHLLGLLYQRPVSISLYMLPVHEILSALHAHPVPTRRRYLLLTEQLLKQLGPARVQRRFKEEFAPLISTLL